MLIYVELFIYNYNSYKFDLKPTIKTITENHNIIDDMIF